MQTIVAGVVQQVLTDTNTSKQRLLFSLASYLGQHWQAAHTPF
jgi:hypothetical protein